VPTPGHIGKFGTRHCPSGSVAALAEPTTRTMRILQRRPMWPGLLRDRWTVPWAQPTNRCRKVRVAADRSVAFGYNGCPPRVMCRRKTARSLTMPKNTTGTRKEPLPSSLRAVCRGTQAAIRAGERTSLTGLFTRSRHPRRASIITDAISLQFTPGRRSVARSDFALRRRRRLAHRSSRLQQTSGPGVVFSAYTPRSFGPLPNSA
jgi:hypothetical protein